MRLDQKSASLLGFMQAVLVAVYCLIISSFLSFMGDTMGNKPEILGGILILFLLVFSAALCGILVFGYPAYLIIQKEIKRALKILGFTFLYAAIIIILILLTVIL